MGLILIGCFFGVCFCLRTKSHLLDFGPETSNSHPTCGHSAHLWQHLSSPQSSQYDVVSLSVNLLDPRVLL